MQCITKKAFFFGDSQDRIKCQSIDVEMVRRQRKSYWFIMQYKTSVLNDQHREHKQEIKKNHVLLSTQCKN